MEETKGAEHNSANPASLKSKTNSNWLIVLVVLFVFCGMAGLAGLGIMRHSGRNIAAREVSQFDGNARGRGMMSGDGMEYGRGNRGMHASSNGAITKIDGDTLTVKISSKEQAVLISEDTAIYDSNGSIIGKTDLKVNDDITVVGRPNSSGQIKALEIIQR